MLLVFLTALFQIEQCDNVLLAIGSEPASDQLWVCGTHAARPILFKFTLNPSGVENNIERDNGDEIFMKFRKTTNRHMEGTDFSRQLQKTLQN